MTADKRTGWDWPTPKQVFKQYAVIGCIGYKIAGRTAVRPYGKGHNLLSIFLAKIAEAPRSFLVTWLQPSHAIGGGSASRVQAAEPPRVRVTAEP